MTTGVPSMWQPAMGRISAATTSMTSSPGARMPWLSSKDEQRDLLQDARSLREQTEPIVTHTHRGQRQCWDFEGFKTWPQCRYPVREVRSLETRQIRRQLDGKLDEVVSDWVWGTTLFRNRVSTSAVVHMGHSRWNIETGDSRSLQPLARRPRLQTSRQRHLVFWLLMRVATQPHLPRSTTETSNLRCARSTTPSRSPG